MLCEEFFFFNNHTELFHTVKHTAAVKESVTLQRNFHFNESCYDCPHTNFIGIEKNDSAGESDPFYPTLHFALRLYANGGVQKVE